METKDVVIDLAKVHSLQTPKHVAYIKMWASGEEQYVLFSSSALIVSVQRNYVGSLMPSM